jgi:hypothetical protein
MPLNRFRLPHKPRSRPESTREAVEALAIAYNQLGVTDGVCGIQAAEEMNRQALFAIDLGGALIGALIGAFVAALAYGVIRGTQELWRWIRRPRRIEAPDDERTSD